MGFTVCKKGEGCQKWRTEGSMSKALFLSILISESFQYETCKMAICNTKPCSPSCSWCSESCLACLWAVVFLWKERWAGDTEKWCFQPQRGQYWNLSSLKTFRSQFSETWVKQFEGGLNKDLISSCTWETAWFSEVLNPHLTNDWLISLQKSFSLCSCLRSLILGCRWCESLLFRKRVFFSLCITQ